MIGAAEFRQHRSKIPQALKESYETYLSNAKKSLYGFRSDLCQAMLIRLQLATASGNISYNDHIHYTANWLLNMGVPYGRLFGVRHQRLE